MPEREKSLTPPRSRQNLPHHPPMDIREPEVTPLEPVGEFFMIKTQLVQKRGVQVMDMDFALDDSETELIRGPVDAGFDSPSRHP